MQELIWQVVAMIPRGKVASYGQIAALIGFPRHSRFVGATLRRLPRDTRLPWHRVVNSSLRISQRGGGEARQRRLLEAEEVTFIGDRILRQHRWDAQA
ncbi:MAG: methylated-DNA--[protein]-cysteine S-methyltransferase [Pseudomonadota bacterium]